MKLKEIFKRLLFESSFSSLQRNDNIWIKKSSENKYQTYTIKWINSDENGKFLEAKDRTGRTITVYEDDIPSKFEISKEQPEIGSDSASKSSNSTKIKPMTKVEFDRNIRYSMNGHETADYAIVADIAENLMHDNSLFLYVVSQLKKIGKLNKSATTVRKDLVKQYVMDHLEGYIE